MLATDIPEKMPTPWASGVTAPFVRDVPIAPPAQAGAASFTDGFPSENFSPIAAGGIPPFGADFNGIHQATTKWLRWVQAGGGVWFFDLAFATEIGGYPAGAMLQAVGAPGNFWISAVDNNVSNPDTGGANWLSFPGTSFKFPSRVVTTNATVNLSCASDYSLGLNRSAPAAMTVNLAATGTLVTNQEFEVADLLGNLSLGPVTVAPPGGMTIGGEATFTMTNDRQYSVFKYFGSNLWGVRA